MASTTTILAQIEPGQAQKEVTANGLLDAASPAMLFGRRAEGCAGLVFAVYGGAMVVDGVLTAIANQPVTCEAATTNYVEASRAGVVSVNTTGFTAGRVPLYQCVTGPSTVTTYTDLRAWVQPAGLSGRLALSVAGDADVTLTAAQARCEALHFTGALTGDIAVIVPDGPQLWAVSNGTTGNYTLTVKTAAGAGVMVEQDGLVSLLTDGTDARLVSPPAPAPPPQVYQVGASWSGAGAEIEVPTDDVSVVCHSTGTITGYTVLTKGGSGSLVIDVWKDSYANYPPDVADSIAASAKPTISGGIKTTDATLTGWTTSVAAGDVVTFHLESVSTFTAVNIFLEITQ